MSSSGCCRGPGRPSGSQLRSTPERRDGRTTLAVIQRIAGLYAVEKEGRGRPPDERVRLRQARAKPVVDDLEGWLHAQLPKISGKSELAKAIRYALARMRKLRPLPRAWLPGSGQQWRRKSPEARSSRQKEFPLRRLRGRRPIRGHCLYPDSERQAERC